jgi:hypothetical protein
MRWIRREVWRPKHDDRRAILPVQLTLRDEIQLVDGIRGGVCPVAVVNPARFQRCPHRVEDGTVLAFGIWLLDAAVVVVSVPCARRKVTRVGIISSRAPSE